MCAQRCYPPFILSFSYPRRAHCPHPFGPQFTVIVSTELRNVEDLARANRNGPALVVAPLITSTNEYCTSQMSSTPTPTQARAFTFGTTSTMPESLFLSPIHDSDTASITSTASGRKRRLWRRSSATSTSSQKQQRSTALRRSRTSSSRRTGCDGKLDPSRRASTQGDTLHVGKRVSTTLSL